MKVVQVGLIGFFEALAILTSVHYERSNSRENTTDEDGKHTEKDFGQCLCDSQNKNAIMTADVACFMAESVTANPDWPYPHVVVLSINGFT